MSNTPSLDSQLLRHTQSPDGFFSVTKPSRARQISAPNRHPSQHVQGAVLSLPENSVELAEPIPLLNQASQRVNRTSPTAAPMQPGQLLSESFFQRLKGLLGMGPEASRTRKALVSLVGTLGYNFIQASAVIALLVAASVVKSPQDLTINQLHACEKPLVVWNGIWLVRVELSSGLGYWSYLRTRAVDDSPRDHSELTTQQVGAQLTRLVDSRQPDRRISTVSGSEDPPIPYDRIYSWLSFFLSIFTLTWFVAAQIFEYTSINTCRLSAPLVWWLTFGILCTMYLLVLEVILFGLFVFIIMPLIMLIYGTILLCMGRRPLRNSHYIKKLPKPLVDRIPLVIYRPSSPDDTSVPKADPPIPVPRKRFAFFHRKTLTDKVMDANSKVPEAGTSGPDTAQEPGALENNMEQSEYPVVRLQGNRPVCALCLKDFEEQRKPPAIPQQASSEDDVLATLSLARDEETEITEEGRPRHEATHEEPQPLRLLACGHVYHKACIDPWLTDVSRRCPVCKRRVEIDERSRRKFWWT